MLREDLYFLGIRYVRSLNKLGLKLWRDIGRKLPLNVQSYDFMKLILDEVHEAFSKRPIETAVIVSNIIHD